VGQRAGERFVVETAAQRSIDLVDGAVRLVVVADTHGLPHPRAAELVAREKPDHILHAGDIGDLAVLEELAKIAPVSAVRGNIDPKTTSVPDALTVDLLDQGTSVFRLLLVHIAVAGPKIRVDAARRATAAGAALVVCGHSHVPFVGRDRGLTVFNPGSIGPRRMHLPIVFGVLELAERRMSLKHIDCETGAQWLP
jgi:putative phosphoesterase